MAVRLLPPTAAAMAVRLLRQKAIGPPKVSGLLKDVRLLRPMAIGLPMDGLLFRLKAVGLSMAFELKPDYPKAAVKRSHPKA